MKFRSAVAFIIYCTCETARSRVTGGGGGFRGNTFNSSEAEAFSVFPIIPEAQHKARTRKFRPIISVFPLTYMRVSLHYADEK